VAGNADVAPSLAGVIVFRLAQGEFYRRSLPGNGMRPLLAWIHRSRSLASITIPVGKTEFLCDPGAIRG
jgi:hypothetical protein